jgi:superfamily II DNA/RNA helicase
MVDWKRVDILVTTPSQLETIMKIKRKREPLAVNPKWFVVDEMDLLLVDKAFSRSTMNIMAYFLGKYKSPFGEENSKRKLVLTGASLKDRIKKVPVREMLEDWFGEMSFVESKDYMKISEKVEHEKLDVSKLDRCDK